MQEESRIQTLPDEQQGTKNQLTLTLGRPREREREEKLGESTLIHEGGRRRGWPADEGALAAGGEVIDGGGGGSKGEARAEEDRRGGGG
jgi:hypothetical protein